MALSIGEQVRSYRTRRGLTQEQLAHLIGRSERWLIDVERGEVDPRLSDAVALAQALCVRVADLTADATVDATAEPNARPPPRRQAITPAARSSSTFSPRSPSTDSVSAPSTGAGSAGRRSASPKSRAVAWGRQASGSPATTSLNVR